MSYEAKLCPVCKGRGQVESGFYFGQLPGSTTGGVNSELCRSCSGEGYLRIEQSNELTQDEEKAFYDKALKRKLI